MCGPLRLKKDIKSTYYEAEELRSRHAEHSEELAERQSWLNPLALNELLLRSQSETLDYIRI